jgi:hypothetical protein
VPVDLLVTYTDNTTVKLHRSIGIWEKGALQTVITTPAKGGIKKIELGSTWVPDADKKDNIYPR